MKWNLKSSFWINSRIMRPTRVSFRPPRRTANFHCLVIYKKVFVVGDLLVNHYSVFVRATSDNVLDSYVERKLPQTSFLMLSDIHRTGSVSYPKRALCLCDGQVVSVKTHNFSNALFYNVSRNER